MSSPDIRAGIALLIAALSAEGKSIIHNVNQIDRGYENIVKRLQNIGAKIQRVKWQIVRRINLARILLKKLYKKH